MATIKNNSPLIAIVGETASGKTAAAIEIAKQVDGEIICADSRTVYEGLPISTAKPSDLDQKTAKHHLISFVDPASRYTAAQFKQQANETISDIASRGKVPILVGGTGLYIDAVLFNFQFRSAPSGLEREKLNAMSMIELQQAASERGIEESLLNTKNKRHLVRIIETDGAPSNHEAIRQNTYVAGIKLSRDELNVRIESRVSSMLKAGLVKEVQNFAKEYGWDNHLIKSSAHGAVRDYAQAVLSVDDVQAAFVKRDKSLAKRQRTWFRRNDAIVWHDSSEELINAAADFIRNQN